MNDDLIETGRIVNTHGVDGKLRVEVWADSPEVLTGLQSIYIDSTPVTVLSAVRHKNNVLMKLEGIDTVERAMLYKGKTICVRREDIPLEDGKYLIADIIGLKAINAETGTVLGIITDVLTMPGNNVYVISGGEENNKDREKSAAGKKESAAGKERELLIPAVSEFIKETNIDEGYVKIIVIEGLT